MPASYAILGDSYSSGEGSSTVASPWDPDSNTAHDHCRRDASAWGRLLAADASLQPRTPVHLACSGAKITNVVSGVTGKTFNTEPPQLTKLTSLGVAPDLITITLGGNDAGFGNVLGACYLGGPVACTSAAAASTAYVKLKLGQRLKSAYRAIHVAEPSARIVVVGYPQLVPGTYANVRTDCPWLTANSLVALRALGRQFDKTISSAAAKAGVEYVSTLNALKGHEMCHTKSWVNDIAVTGSAAHASAHPNVQGQVALEGVVAKYLTTVP